MTPIFYWVMVRLTRYFLLALYARVEVTGLENIPAKGPLLIVANHLNDADPAILATRIPRRIAFMAKAEMFKVPLLAQVARALGAFPVRRNEADLSALRRAGETLKAGLALGIFPEGRTTTRAAQLAEAWPGAALIALRSQAPLLPVAITGSQYLQWPLMFLRLFRRCRVTLTIGKPFVLPKPLRLNAEAATAGTQTIMARIAALLPEEYRGYYGDARFQDSAASPTGESRGS